MNSQNHPETDFQAIFRQIPGYYIVLEPDTLQIVAVSDEYLDITGYARENLVGRRLHQVFPDDPNNPDASGTANLMASVEQVRNTLHKDIMALQNHPIPNPVSGELENRVWSPVNSPVLDEDGRLLYIIHRSHDVTHFVQGHPDVTSGEALQDQKEASEIIRNSIELKQMAEQLRLNEERLQAIFRDASMGIGVTDLDGRFLEANAAYCEMLGYSLEELRALNFLDITHPDEHEETLRLRDTITHGTEPRFIYEKRYIRKDGQIIWCRISGSPLRDRNGRVSSLIAIVDDITAQKESQEQLKQGEALARITGKIARVGGWVVSYDNPRHVHWAREVFEIFGYDGDSAPSLQQIIPLFQPEHALKFKRALDLCEHEGVEFDLETIAKTFTGKPLWLRIAGRPDFDDQGRIVRTIGTVQDITRQKQELEQNQQLSNRLFTTLETMSDAFIMLDRAFNILYTNTVAERMLNTRQQAITGSFIWDSFPHFRDSPLFNGFNRARLYNQPFETEFYSDTLNDWLEVNVYPSPEGLAVYLRVTTERKRLLAGLAESEQRLKYVTRATLDAAWDYNLKTSQLWWSESAEKLFGIKHNLIMDSTDFWLERVHPDDRALVNKTLRSLSEGISKSSSIIYRLQHNDDHYIYVEDRGFAILNDAGKPVRLVGGMTDISDRREMESHLQQSQRLESLGHLTGGVAHDFNNLLTVIVGNAELLQEQLEHSEKLKNLAELIAKAAQRGADLTQRLLAFARKQNLEPSLTNLNQMLTSMLDILRHTLDRRYQMKFHCNSELWLTLVDQNQLEAAILNLCINARDAMPNGGQLTIETDNVVLDEEYARLNSDISAGSYVMISVTDTGMGIPPDVIDHVFEPFFTTKEQGKGTGLGLSTLFGFIKQSNGHVRLYSEPGRGTTVKLFLPRGHGQEEFEEQSGNRHLSDNIGGEETILLVEDDNLVKNYAITSLETLGYTVIVSKDEGDALRILESPVEIDLLFTDVIMPVISGVDLAQKAKKIRPELKILFTSGYTERSISNSGKISSDDQLLEKPYQKLDLANKVRAVLDARPRQNNTI